MAASAGAARRTASARRRPAARRRPGARRGASRIQWDRVGRIALTLVLAAVLYSYFNPVIDFVKTYTATSAAKAKFHEELRTNKRAHYRVQHAGDPIVIDERGRGQGMIAPGEKPYIMPPSERLSGR
jgi:hypothetical protein